MRHLVRQCELRGVAYGAEFSPLSDITLALILKRCWIEFEYVPELGVDEIIWPPSFGAHQMTFSADLAPGQRRFAMRHGLAHVLAGHTLGPQHDAGWRSWEESVADAFALVDVIPDWRLDELRHTLTSEEVERWAYAEVARWTGWPPKRIANRVSARLA